jgi:hypothetical protein
MPRFFIEVPHEEGKTACARAAQTLLKTGSHFLTHADFGCLDGEHKALLIVDVESKEMAQAIIPAEYRSQAKIVQLNKFNLEELNNLLDHHKE